MCEEEGFAEAVDDAIATIDLPIEDRGSLVVVILSDNEGNDSDMEYENRENVTPETAAAGRKRDTTKDKRKKRAYIADDSEDDDPRPVSNAMAFEVSI